MNKMNEAGQLIYVGGVAQNGKKYIEAETGSVEIGAEVVKFVCANTRRGGVVIPEHYDTIGKIVEAGKSFLASTKEDAILRGDANPHDVYNTRYYIGG